MKMPEQVKRLIFVFVILILFFVLVRSLLVPPTFGEYGHYRAASIKDIISQEIKYAGEVVCSECHDDMVEMKSASYHKRLSCEVCHGPAYQHSQAPDEYTPPAPRKRGYCVLCHGYNSSRPTGFPQIDPVRHNPRKPCIKCHNPHDPTPPEVPRECKGCHEEIYRTKILSPHALLKCTECHTAPEEHKINPRAYKPTKPQRRKFCGKCHGREAEVSEEIPRVDLIYHGYGNLCWDCHYPHYPEAHITQNNKEE
jgi:hypothetical protein